MPSGLAAAWIVAKSPVRPTMSWPPWASSHSRIRLGVSRSGSVVTKTTWSLSCSALGSFFSAAATSETTVEQTSGQ